MYGQSWLVLNEKFLNVSLLFVTCYVRQRVKAQGALVYIPHAFDRIRPSALKRETLERILPDIDIIEVLNSRCIIPRDNAKARHFAKKYRLLTSAGSDAHTPGEIGNAYVEMPDFNGIDTFRLALAQGNVVGHVSSPLVHFASAFKRFSHFFKK